MRTLYITVALFLILSLLLFIGSFIYLDKEKHKIYYYVINLDGYDIGTIRVDKFETEDKLLYRSVSNMPFAELFTESKTRLALDRKYDIDNYFKETYGNAATESVYMEKSKNSISFVSKYQARFTYLDNIPIKKYTFIFEESSPVTYLPIIENYNFKRGRSQGFNAITFFSPSLPPMKRFVTLTSIRNEYLKVDSRKIKTENLILKIKNYPQGMIWVARSDRSLIRLEIPEKGLRITRSFSPKIADAKEYSLTSEEYISKDVAFKNKNVQLTGTLTLPKKEGIYPAVLLIWGSGPQDRQYQGFFSTMADYLSKNGFCVLRFDKRGCGSSGGDSSVCTDNDIAADVNAALEYLISQKEVDPGKVAIIAHSKGVSYALKAALEESSVKALVLMAPSEYLGLEKDQSLDALRKMALKYKWKNDYLKSVIESIQKTNIKATTTERNWVYTMGRRCYLKNLREALAEKPIDLIKKVNIAVLILQGRQDDEVSVESASMLDGMLEEGGNRKHALTYFGYLGHFFGKKINDGIHRVHYEVDKEVLDTIKSWLDKNFTQKEDLKVQDNHDKPVVNSND